MVFELLKSIKKVVLERYEWPVRDKRVELLEDHPDATCQKLTIKEAENLVVFKFDRAVKDLDGILVEEPFPFLSAEPPVRSKCDYIIFHARIDHKGRERLHVLVCNMKSKQRSNMGDQLRAGRILAEFIMSTSIRCQNHWNSNVSGYVALSSSEIKAMIDWRDIAITSAAPATKGRSKVKLTAREKAIECNKTYPLERLLA